jgi:hypothetical protein
MATTTNFGWETPDDTDLVKDGAAAIRTSLNGVDTSFVDLKGGTSGQVLAKNSGTDLDYVWVTPTDQTPLTTKGDLFTFSTVDARLGVGTNGQLLQADSVAATGLSWITKAESGQVLITTASFTTSAAVNVNSCFSATYDHYLVILNVSATASFGTGDVSLRLRASGVDNSSSNYAFNGAFAGTSSAAITGQRSAGLTTAFKFDYGALEGIRASFRFYSPFLAQRTGLNAQCASALASNDSTTSNINGTMSVTTSYDGFSIIPPAGTITGTLSVYGMVK